MLTVSNYGLFAIMLVFVIFGGFTAGWNAGYKYKEKEDADVEKKKNQRIAELEALYKNSTPHVIAAMPEPIIKREAHVIDIKASADISDSFIKYNGFNEAQRIASDGVGRQLAEQALKYCDLHMEHDPQNQKYTFKARLRVLDDDGEPLVIPEAWKRFND